GAEHPMGAGATSMHHTFGDALVVEVHDLLAQVVVLQQHRAARPGLERMISVGQAQSLGSGQSTTGLGTDIGVGAGIDAGGGNGPRCLLLRFGRRRLARGGGLRNRWWFGGGRPGDVDIADGVAGPGLFSRPGVVVSWGACGGFGSPRAPRPGLCIVVGTHPAMLGALWPVSIW